MPPGQYPVIPYHASDKSKEEFERSFDHEIKMIAKKHEQIKNSVVELPRLITAPLHAAGFAHYLTPDDPRIPDWLRLSINATLAACNLAEPTAGPLTVDLGYGAITLPPTNRPLVTALDITTAIYCAFILRDEALIRALADVDLGTLEPEGVTIESWALYWTRSLQGFSTGESWVQDSLLRAMEDSAPEKYDPGSIFYAACLNIASCDMGLMMAAGKGPEKFNEMLFETVKGYNYFHDVCRFDPLEWQQNDPMGFIDWGAVAFASVVNDRGWPIEVRSPYLPLSLIERS